MTGVRVFGLILLAGLLAGCGASHAIRETTLYQAPDFTYDQIKQKGLIVGGLASTVVQLTDEMRLKYSLDLGNILLEKLKDVHKIRLVNTVQLIEQIGPDTYFAFMRNFDQAGKPGLDTLAIIKNAINEISYILFACMENENVIDNSSYEIIEKEDGGKEEETEYEKTYLLTVNFQLYDLGRNELVWNQIIHNEAYQTETRTTRTGCVESCMDNLITSILFGSPAEISREEVFAKITEKLAQDLQKIKMNN